MKIKVKKIIIKIQKLKIKINLKVSRNRFQNIKNKKLSNK